MENRNLLDGDVTCPHNVSFFFWFETDKKIDLETRNDVLFLLQVEQKTIEQKKRKKIRTRVQSHWLRQDGHTQESWEHVR